MKHIPMILMITVMLVACSTASAASTQVTAEERTAPMVTSTEPVVTPEQTTTDNIAEVVEVRDLVEDFGKRLQDVALLSPDVSQEIQAQYSDLVSPDLLKTWMSDVSNAPGRMVSSPWPDRIDISNVEKESSDTYVITGNVIEVTSLEVVNGGEAARIPVRVVVQNVQGNWLISGYTEGH